MRSRYNFVTNLDAPIPIIFEDTAELEEDNPHDLYRLPANETCPISTRP